MRTRIWLLTVAVLVIAAAFGGCEDDAAGPDPLTGRAGVKVGLDFVLLGLPGGDAEVPDPPVADLDTATYPTDLFGRGAPSRDPVFVQWGDLDIDATTDWIAPRFWFDDPRLPRLQEHAWDDDYGANMDWIEFQRPDRSSRIDRWDYRSDIDYIGDLDAWYAIGLVRYGTVVNGLVDHVEILVYDGEVLQPDSLVLLGGSPGGYPDHQSDFIVWADPPDDYCPPMLADANPFIMGHFKTGPTVDPKDGGADYDGETDADYCFLGSGLWQSGYDNDLHPDSVPFAPNNFETFGLPQYNYLVTWEYDTLTGEVLYDRPYMRAQIGVALDENGQPLAHGFAPFPAPPGHELSDYATYADFLADPGVTPGVTSADMTVYNLKPLASGSAYQVWLVDEVEMDAVRVSPTYTLQRPDTTGFTELDEPIIEWVDEAAPQTADSFDGATGLRHIIQLRNADLGLEMALYTHVVITIGGTGDASPLNSPAPVWYRYQDQNGTRTDPNDNDIFVTSTAQTGFIPDPDLAAEGVGWSALGGGGVEYLNRAAFTVGLRRLSRPPLGYYYAVWLVNEDAGTDLYVGEITTPPPEMYSLLDADADPVAADIADVVTPGEILEAVRYATWDDLNIEVYLDVTPQGERIPRMEPKYTHVYVTLEPKSGDPSVRAETVIFSASIPEDLALLPEEKTAS